MSKTNRGTIEGEEYEKEFCVRFNKRDSNIDLTCLSNINLNNIYAVHVNRHKFSSITQKKVKPKSDAFLAKLTNNQVIELQERNFFIDEQFFHKKLEFIKNSGVSIKNKGSKDYQIHKFNFNAFKRIFPDEFLFIGAQVYSTPRMISKNSILLKNFQKDKENFLNHFKESFDVNDSDENKYKKIKTFCNNEIKKIIEKSENVNNIVFTGKNVFEDPFYASFFFQDDVLSPINEVINNKFSVTTGSGRSKAKSCAGYSIKITPTS